MARSMGRTDGHIIFEAARMQRLAIFLIVVPLIIGILFRRCAARHNVRSQSSLPFQAQLSQAGGLDSHLADLDYPKKQTSRK